MTELRIYKCSCDGNIAVYTEKEMKVHAREHKAARDKVVVETLAGYSFEI